MNWLDSLFFGTGVPHSIFVLTLAIACGIFLSHRLKFKGITLGITWILFCAIAFAHFGMHIDPMVESFAKDFGLILFVYSDNVEWISTILVLRMSGQFSLNVIPKSNILASLTSTPFLFINLMT